MDPGAGNLHPRLNELPPPPEDKSGWPWDEFTEPMPETMPDDSPWPRISIVTPSYNQGQFIEETIRSVLLQGYPNLEYIIIDGGSTDGSVEIIKKYEPWLSYWVSEKDRGQTHAINKGIGHCTGSIFGFINSDDIYYPGAFDDVARICYEKDSMGKFWICGQANLVDENSTLIKARENRFGNDALDWYFHRLKEHGTSIVQPSSFWSLKLFEKIGFFDEDFNFSFDYEFFVRLYANGINWITTDHIYSAFRIHETSKTKSNSTFFIEEDYRLAKKYLKTCNTKVYKRWLSRMGLMAARAKLTRIVEEEQSIAKILKSVIPLIIMHPSLLLLKRTYRWIKNVPKILSRNTLGH